MFPSLQRKTYESYLRRVRSPGALIRGTDLQGTDAKAKASLAEIGSFDVYVDLVLVPGAPTLFEVCGD